MIFLFFKQENQEEQTDSGENANKVEDSDVSVCEMQEELDADDCQALANVDDSVELGCCCFSKDLFNYVGSQAKDSSQCKVRHNDLNSESEL